MLPIRHQLPAKMPLLRYISQVSVLAKESTVPGCRRHLATAATTAVSSDKQRVTLNNVILYRHFPDQQALLTHLEAINTSRQQTLEVPVQNFVLKLFTSVQPVAPQDAQGKDSTQRPANVRVATLRSHGNATVNDLASQISKTISVGSVNPHRQVLVLTPKRDAKPAVSRSSILFYVRRVLRVALERALERPHAAMVRDITAKEFAAVDPSLGVLKAISSMALYVGIQTDPLQPNIPYSPDQTWTLSEDGTMVVGRDAQGNTIELYIAPINGGVNLGLEGGSRSATIKALTLVVLISTMILVLYTYVSQIRSTSDSSTPHFIDKHGQLRQAESAETISFLHEPMRWFKQRMGFDNRRKEMSKEETKQAISTMVSDPIGWMKARIGSFKSKQSSVEHEDSLRKPRDSESSCPENNQQGSDGPSQPKS